VFFSHHILIDFFGQVGNFTSTWHLANFFMIILLFLKSFFVFFKSFWQLLACVDLVWRNFPPSDLQTEPVPPSYSLILLKRKHRR
jgi:hypothetical protein